MTTYMFPGQGSQVKGMGSDLFPHFPEQVKSADNILGYSIARLCTEDADNQLNITSFTQPALYVVNALTYLKIMADNKKAPDYAIGHSLGEYNALFAAGVFDFETGLKLVKKRGELMARATGGGMAAVVGLSSETILTVLEKNNLTMLTIANYNTLTQSVISGPVDAIRSAEKPFIDAGALLYMPLKVSGAFHSSYMNEAQNEFKSFLTNVTFSQPKIQVIANINAGPYKVEDVASNLTAQINHSVMWTQTIKYLLDKGETLFTEIGPGKVLTGLLTKIQKGQ